MWWKLWKVSVCVCECVCVCVHVRARVCLCLCGSYHTWMPNKIDFSLFLSPSFILLTIHYNPSFYTLLLCRAHNFFSTLPLSALWPAPTAARWKFNFRVLWCPPPSLPPLLQAKKFTDQPPRHSTHTPNRNHRRRRKEGNNEKKRSVKKRDMISCGFRSSTLSGQSYIIHFHEAHSDISYSVGFYFAKVKRGMEFYMREDYENIVPNK